MIKSLYKGTAKAMLFAGLSVLPLASCSDSYMSELNTDDTKPAVIDPNTQLTTALLQTYGDFGLMDTYRSYITGFTQHLAGGWNVTNYAGSVNANDSQMALLWDKFYSVGIKNLVDAIKRTEGVKPNLNAALRVHRVYMLSILTDTYGDVPCTEAGMGYYGVANPKYDKQEDIYNFFFEELEACVNQFDEKGDAITGDVTGFNGDIKKWRSYANTLRMRYAMRISDVNPQKAEQEFVKAVKSPAGYMDDSSKDAYVCYMDGPFTLYKGAQEGDFRVNALGEILYGQDPTSPSFICTTFFNKMKDYADPRLYHICRHYVNRLRSEIKPDVLGNYDVTDLVREYEESEFGDGSHPCDVGAAWWNNWVNAPSDGSALAEAFKAYVAKNPDKGIDQDNYNARMMRPFLSIDLEMPTTPGILMTCAETHFLLAEALLKGWNLGVEGDMVSHYEAGVCESMRLLNKHYISKSSTDVQMDDWTDIQFYAALLATEITPDNAKEMINTQAWILHLTNPSEAWANLRRSDYPALADRNKLGKFDGFTYDDANLTTPVRLLYPNLEENYNGAHYKEAIARIQGEYNWHKRVWWDTKEQNFK